MSITDNVVAPLSDKAVPLTSVRKTVQGEIRCTPVKSRIEFATFIRLPRIVYADIKDFVPRLDFAERQALDPKHAPFFRHGIAQYWLAWRDGKAVGRVSAQIDYLQNEHYGMFGCLDSINDAEVVFSLMRQAENWLREHGCTASRGPFSLSINGESGLMTMGQEAGPMILMPWHPSYIAAHLAAAQYEPVKHLLAYAMDLQGVSASDLTDIVRIPQLSQSIRIRGLNLKDLDTEAKVIADVFNDAWRDNWGFVPITKDEVSSLARAFRIFLVPECGVIIEANGVPIAVALILPNLSAMAGDFDGALLPINWARLLYQAVRKDYVSGRLALFGVVRRLRGTILGSIAPFAMLREFARHKEKCHLQELEMSWVLEDNYSVQSAIERFGGRITKRYTVFEKVF